MAALIGPTIAVTVVSEFPSVQPHLYDMQIPPVVYISGLLMFIAGLAIVRAHNIWARNWTVLITLTGWCLLALGVVRMFAAEQYINAATNASSPFFMVLEGILFLIAAVITYHGYRPVRGEENE